MGNRGDDKISQLTLATIALSECANIKVNSNGKSPFLKIFLLSTTRFLLSLDLSDLDLD